MKAGLLGAVLVKRDEWQKTRLPSDRQLIRQLQADGAFLRWKEETLLAELSRARRWVRSEEGQKWSEQDEARTNALCTHMAEDS
jgi:hypothetical protein